jgi:hypothetical protein
MVVDGLIVFSCMYGVTVNMCLMASQSVSQIHVNMYGVRDSACMMVSLSVSQSDVCMFMCMNMA